jgi:hypothetical protein
MVSFQLLNVLCMDAKLHKKRLPIGSLFISNQIES